MKILRLSTLSLTLAVAVFALGYNPSFADQPRCGDNADQHCNHGDDPGGLTYTVDLNGPDRFDLTIRGAFEFNPAGMASAKNAILEKGALNGVQGVDMSRPGNTVDCTSVISEEGACRRWEDVFRLCDLLGTPNRTMISTVAGFSVSAGDWQVS